MTFWLNGAFREEEAAIDIADRGFLLGDGVFETVLLVDGVPAFLTAHLERMRGGAKALGIEARLDEAELAGVLAGLARRNSVHKGFATARLTLTRGAGARGLAIATGAAKPTLLVTVSAYAPPEPSSPARLIVSRHRRNELSAAARWKTLNYLDNILARMEAAGAGADEALMLNSAGRAACASAANVFFVIGDAIVTPPAGEGALPGIVRGVLLEKAKAAGAGIREAPVEARAFEGATVFLTNSLIGVRAAALPGAGGGGGKVLERLQTCYADAMRLDLQERAKG